MASSTRRQAVGDRAARGRAIAAAALGWYAEHGRELAFRRASDPWAVLVSEVMAQQTQAARAAEAWTRFIARFPTPAALAAASPATVIREWRGLGYNRRALALRGAAIAIVLEHDGRVPESLDALLRLPGVGPYTARAVLAVAFGHPVAALDTNIRRVLDRSLGGLPRSAAALQDSADALVPPARAAEWTHALMDIGATICPKRDPRCTACPLAAACSYRSAPTASTGTHASVRRAAPFRSTRRWLRGRILDRLRDAPDGAWVEFASAIGTHPPAAVAAALRDLAAEGLVDAREGVPRARLRFE